MPTICEWWLLNFEIGTKSFLYFVNLIKSDKNQLRSTRVLFKTTLEALL